MFIVCRMDETRYTLFQIDHQSIDVLGYGDGTLQIVS